jgi:hypothetical protein
MSWKGNEPHSLLLGSFSGGGGGGQIKYRRPIHEKKNTNDITMNTTRFFCCMGRMRSEIQDLHASYSGARGYVIRKGNEEEGRFRLVGGLTA